MAGRTREVIIAAVDDGVIDAALRYRQQCENAGEKYRVRIVDASRAIAPGQPQADARGVERVVLDPNVPIIADAPLKSSALLAEWLAANVADSESALVLLPADGGVAYFSVAQHAQRIATSNAVIAVYMTDAPPIASIGNEHMLSDIRVLELTETARRSVENADILLTTSQVDAKDFAKLQWSLPIVLTCETIDEATISLSVEKLQGIATVKHDSGASDHKRYGYSGDLYTSTSQIERSPRVTVCVTHYNRPQLLLQTLASIERQDYSNFDVVLVDDGSTSSEANALLDTLHPVFNAKGWQIVRQTNSYLGAARNNAVRHATGEWILFIDDDDCMRDGYISTFVKAVTSTGADIATCFLEYFEGTDEPTPNTRVHHRWVMPGPIGAGTIIQNTFGGANAIVRKELYEKLGGYTEDHGVGFEDWEFYNRAFVNGARFEVIPRPLLWCRWGIGGMQASANRHAQQQARASRPAVEAMPTVWRELPQLAQGFAMRNRDLVAHIEHIEKENARLRSQIEKKNHTVGNAVTPQELPPRIGAALTQRTTVHVWHTEGMGLSGILSWMWRLREHFAPDANINIRLIDLAVLPYGFQQAGADPSAFYNERIATSQQFLEFLQRTANDVHVVNHAFSYLTSMVEQLGEDVLRGLRLIGVCHTDQEYYYANLERLAPVLRRIIAVSPTCAATLALRIPDHANKIVTLPAWAVKLQSATAEGRKQSEPLRILYTGRILNFQKRVFDLAELVVRLKAARVNATLTIVGDGPDLDELKKRVEDVSNRSIPVTFEPVRPPWEMEELLMSHHMFVQVSEFEGASVSLMEALAFGLVPAVTVTRSGHDLISANVNAITAKVGDMKQLASQIAALSSNPAKHNRMAKAARNTAERYLEELAYPERLASLVQSVAAS